jgi:hypothetical protein
VEHPGVESDDGRANDGNYFAEKQLVQTPAAHGSILHSFVRKDFNILGAWFNRVFQFIATRLLPEYPNPAASSTITITSILCFSEQIQAPASAEFGQPGIS